MEYTGPNPMADQIQGQLPPLVNMLQVAHAGTCWDNNTQSHSTHHSSSSSTIRTQEFPPSFTFLGPITQKDYYQSETAVERNAETPLERNIQMRIDNANQCNREMGVLCNVEDSSENARRPVLNVQDASVLSTEPNAEISAEPTAISFHNYASVPFMDVIQKLVAHQGKNNPITPSSSDLIPARALALEDMNNPILIANILGYLDSQAPRQLNGHKQRVEISKEDDRALLVKLCHENFGLYQPSSKTKFYDLMRIKFWIATGGRLDVNVKGYMERWEDKRRQDNLEDVVKSGMARNVGEFELAMDSWIAAIEDFDALRGSQKDAKKVTAVAAAEEKDRIEQVRDNMMRTMVNKKRNRSETDDGSGPVPAANSKRQMSDRVLDGLREENREMMDFLSASEQRRMDRWESLLLPLVTGLTTVERSSSQEQDGSQSIHKRLEAMEEKTAGNSNDIKQILELVKGLYARQ